MRQSVAEAADGRIFAGVGNRSDTPGICSDTADGLGLEHCESRCGCISLQRRECDDEAEVRRRLAMGMQYVRAEEQAPEEKVFRSRKGPPLSTSKGEPS
jgi:hypothetical protein